MAPATGPTCPREQVVIFFAWLAADERDGEVNQGVACMVAGLKRCGKSCRLRYTNYLRPNLKHENFTQEEEDLIVTLHAMLGSRYSTVHCCNRASVFF